MVLRQRQSRASGSDTGEAIRPVMIAAIAEKRGQRRLWCSAPFLFVLWSHFVEPSPTPSPLALCASCVVSVLLALLGRSCWPYCTCCICTQCTVLLTLLTVQYTAQTVLPPWVRSSLCCSSASPASPLERARCSTEKREERARRCHSTRAVSMQAHSRKNGKIAAAAN